MIVYFIYCDGCVDCKIMERVISETLKELGAEYDITRFNCDTDEAIDLAIEYDIDDVPACVFLNDAKTKHKKYAGPRSCQKDDVKDSVKYVGK